MCAMPKMPQLHPSTQSLHYFCFMTGSMVLPTCNKMWEQTDKLCTFNFDEHFRWWYNLVSFTDLLQADRATNVIHSLVRFYNTLMDDKLEPNIIHRKPWITDTTWFRNIIRWRDVPLHCDLVKKQKCIKGIYAWVTTLCIYHPRNYLPQVLRPCWKASHGTFFPHKSKEVVGGGEGLGL